MPRGSRSEEWMCQNRRAAVSAGNPERPVHPGALLPRQAVSASDGMAGLETKAQAESVYASLGGEKKKK